MGLLYLAACLRESGDHQAKIIDGRLLELSPKKIMERAEEFDPDVIGITCLTMEGPEAHENAALCKQRWPDRPVLLGGPYTTSEPEKSISDPNIDVCFLGEAEKSFVRWVEAQESGTGLSQLTGITYRHDGEINGLHR
jgi:radical SAM superfamily enzyme YgiQ (UPF0313 family)